MLDRPPKRLEYRDEAALRIDPESVDSLGLIPCGRQFGANGCSVRAPQRMSDNDSFSAVG
jgi:hypothetical protein